MDDPTASIVIRCYNEADHIGRLLHGIEQQTIDDVEVVVVDSGSTDGTLEIVDRHDVDQILHIAPEAFSFGRALNEGCAAATGRYYVFASAHVYPTHRDWLELLLDGFDRDDVALVYGKQRAPSDATIAEQRVFERWYPEASDRRQDSPFCNNANAAIRSDVWERYPYDESLTGLEDLDWAKRVRSDGYEVSYVADAEIVHVHDETWRQIYDRYRREGIAHATIMPDQRFGLRDLVKATTTNVVRDYLAAIRRGEIRGNLIAIPVFRLMQFWGTYRGFARDDPVTRDLRRRFFYPDDTAVEHDESEDPSHDTGRLEVDYEDVPE